VGDLERADVPGYNLLGESFLGVRAGKEDPGGQGRGD